MFFLFDDRKLERSISELYAFCTGLEVRFVFYKEIESFNFFLDFQVSQDDDFPQYICKSCLFKLEEAYELKKTCIESYNILKNLQTNNEMQKNEEIEFNCIEYIEIEEENETEELSQEDSRKLESPEQQEVLEFSTDHLYCNLCEKQFEAESKFLTHLKIHHPQYPDAEDPENVSNVCYRCELSFESITDFQNHLEDFHFVNGLYECEEPNCSAKITTAALAYQHLNSYRYPGLFLPHILKRHEKF